MIAECKYCNGLGGKWVHPETDASYWTRCEKCKGTGKQAIGIVVNTGVAWVHIECNRYRQLTSNILMVDDAILTFKEKISEIVVTEGG